MSGSNSSVRDAVPEPLALTVHSLPVPEVQTRRVRHGRIKMLLVLLACAAPVIASYSAFFLLRPEGRSNYSTLIQPTRTMPELSLRSLDGAQLSAAALHGQWLIVAVGPAACDAACDMRRFMQRQLREMLGRERTRIDKVWLITDDEPLAPRVRDALGGDASLHVLRASRDAIGRWLEAEPGRALQDHLYLVDPMGEWMMRAPADPDPARLKRDLDRLLRASAAWDRPGR
jgi:hypothetical protein